MGNIRGKTNCLSQKKSPLSTFPIPKQGIPSKQEIVARLEAMVGCKYIWGGNVSRGVKAMLEWFPPQKKID